MDNSTKSPRRSSTDVESDEESLFQATLDWIASSTGQNLSSTSIHEVFKDGKILITLQNKLDPSSQQADPAMSPIASKDKNNFFVFVRVDEFLKFCKSMGLQDHELFSGSDIVHQNSQNWKRVCLSLRSLARECSKRGMDVKEFGSSRTRRQDGSPETHSVVQRYMSHIQSESQDNKEGSKNARDGESSHRFKGGRGIEASSAKNGWRRLRGFLGSSLILFSLVGTGILLAKGTGQVKVRSGDHLWRLARERNQPIEDILAANPQLRSNPSLIFPDEYIALRP